MIAARMRILNKRSILLCPSSLLSTTNHHRHISSINHHSPSPSLSSFMSSNTMMHQSMNRFMMVRFYSSSKSNMQQQEYEVNDELQDRPISKALFVMNRLAESGDSKQLTLFLEKFLDSHNTSQSQAFHEELEQIDAQLLESIHLLIEKTTTTPQIPKHKLYHSLSELMSVVNRVDEAQRFNQLSLECIRGYNVDNFRDRVAHAIYQLKRASMWPMETEEEADKKMKHYTSYLTEVGPHVNSSNGHLIARVYYEKAGHLINQDKLKESLPDMERAFTILEGFYGWVDSLTCRVGASLSRVYLDVGRIDFGIIMAEKTLIGMELYPTMFDLDEITLLGIHLARSYEKKKYFPNQQATLTRTFNLLKRRKSFEDPQLYQECVFKLENILASSKYLAGEYPVAFTILKKLNDQTNDENFMNAWMEKDEADAGLEYAFMKYFRGATLIRMNDFDGGVRSLNESKDKFTELGRDDWVKRVSANIDEALSKIAEPAV